MTSSEENLSPWIQTAIFVFEASKDGVRDLWNQRNEEKSDIYNYSYPFVDTLILWLMINREEKASLYVRLRITRVTRRTLTRERRGSKLQRPGRDLTSLQ